MSERPDLIKYREAAVEAALTAFWAVIAKHYPLAKSGDFPVDLTVEQQELANRYVQVWLDYNHEGEQNEQS